MIHYFIMPHKTYFDYAKPKQPQISDTLNTPFRYVDTIFEIAASWSKCVMIAERYIGTIGEYQSGVIRTGNVDNRHTKCHWSDEFDIDFIKDVAELFSRYVKCLYSACYQLSKNYRELNDENVDVFDGSKVLCHSLFARSPEMEIIMEIADRLNCIVNFFYSPDNYVAEYKGTYGMQKARPEYTANRMFNAFRITEEAFNMINDNLPKDRRYACAKYLSVKTEYDSPTIFAVGSEEKEKHYIELIDNMLKVYNLQIIPSRV